MADLPIKALSIRQPWAWAIVHAGKDIENRDWATKFRGPVCIYAAKSVPASEFKDAAEFISMAQRASGQLRPKGHPWRKRAIDLHGLRDLDNFELRH